MNKPLSAKQAGACEQAAAPACTCRCGGALHGAKRGDGRAFFEALPADDPHYLPSDAQKALRNERARLVRRIERLTEYPGAADFYRRELAVLDGLPTGRADAALEPGRDEGAGGAVAREGAKVIAADEQRAHMAADDAWQNELVRLFGRRAGDVRYTEEGRTGPVLAPLYAEFRRTADCWRRTADAGLLTPDC
jgi:hypothetical protein